MRKFNLENDRHPLICYTFKFLLIAIVLACITSMFGCMKVLNINRLSADELVIKYGNPDIISERAGDMERFYKYNHTPEDVWPKAIKKYYYVQKDTGFEIKNGYVIKSFPIGKELKETLLIPLMKGTNKE